MCRFRSQIIKHARAMPNIFASQGRRSIAYDRLVAIPRTKHFSDSFKLGHNSSIMLVLKIPHNTAWSRGIALIPHRRFLQPDGWKDGIGRFRVASN
jgi:hypothetical protein